MSGLIKILSIGNSFSQDAHGYLHQILSSADVDSLCVDLIIGGCTLETHSKNIENNLRNYILEINSIQSKSNVSIEEFLDLYDWDVITNQQASLYSGVESSFEPYLGRVLSYIDSKSPSSRKFLQKTWAYESDAELDWFKMYDRDQLKMYRQITECFDKFSSKYGIPYIPSGDVIQALRGTEYFNYTQGGLKITRDGFHLNIPYGRYAVGLTWAKMLADVDPEDVSYVPEGADASICAFIRRFVSDFLKRGKN